MSIYRAICHGASRFWSWIQSLFSRQESSESTQFQMNRRFRILAAFFCVWALAIVVQTASLTLLGYQIGGGSNGNFAYLTFLVGISWQFIFQGPTELEVLEHLRSRSKDQPPKIDQLYLTFNISRTIRLIVVLIVFTFVICLTGLVRGDAAWGSATVAASVCTAAWLRIRMVRARVSADQFGSTQYEARQLLGFLSKLYRYTGDQFDPPGPLHHRYEGELPSAVPLNAEVVL